MGKDEGVELVSIPAELVSSGGFEAKEVASIPVIDGIGDDDCWKTTEWNPIDQLWIPWGENNIPLEDFNGKFKLMWSSTTDLLYFIVETVDDVFVDGYVYPADGYHNFDVIEVFIDEDKSGGDHIFDAGETNAENAFSYHVNINLPADGSSTSTATVEDIAGTSWGDKQIPDNFNHFPEFTVKRDGNKLTWEFSLQVHNDSYDKDNQAASLVDLTEGKVMGLSMAYCDNDTPGTDRDNFFGSVEVTADRYNSHWENADDYGVLSLVAATAAINHAPLVTSGIDDFEFSEKDLEKTIVADLDEHFMDEDGDALTYKAAADDVYLELNIEGSVLKGTVKGGFNHSSVVTIIAEDEQQFSATVQFTVTASNSAPHVLRNLSDQEIDPGTTESVTTSLTSKFSDDDGDELTITGESNDDELSVSISGNLLEITATEDFVGPAIVTITASDGEDSVDMTFEVTSTVGIAQDAIKSSLQLYPNPVTTDQLNIRFESDHQGSVMLRIVGMNGQLHQSRFVNKEVGMFDYTFPVSNLAKGIYILEIHQDGAKVNRTFVK